MAGPGGGAPTRVPSSLNELVSHAVPLTTATACVTPRRFFTCAPSPVGSPPGVQASSVSGVRVVVWGGGLVATSGGRNTEGRGWLWAAKPIRPPPTTPRTKARGTPAQRVHHFRLACGEPPKPTMLMTAPPVEATLPPSARWPGRKLVPTAIDTRRRRSIPRGVVPA